MVQRHNKNMADSAKYAAIFFFYALGFERGSPAALRPVTGLSMSVLLSGILLMMT